MRKRDETGPDGLSRVHAPGLSRESLAREGTLGAAEVARRLHVSISTVHRMSETGELRCGRAGPGAPRRFAEADVRALERGRGTAHSSGASSDTTGVDAATAAEMFDLFDAGKSLVEVVKVTRAHPNDVRALHVAYLMMKEPGGEFLYVRRADVVDVQKHADAASKDGAGLIVFNGPMTGERLIDWVHALIGGYQSGRARGES